MTHVSSLPSPTERPAALAAPATPDAAALPPIIQGGMGIGVSNWRLANAVARCGQLGVVSGTVIDTLLVRRLQDGDVGGHMRRALAAFPVPGIAEELLARYFRPEGRPAGTPYKLLPMYRQTVSAARHQVTIAASFVETWLAREGHDGPIGMNLLTKVQMPNLPTLYGAMLAGVSCVIMGAGIPREIPGALDALALHQPAKLKFDVEGLGRDEVEWLTFDPATIWPDGELPAQPLMRPAFLPVVSAVSLAATLARKSTGRVDGFVVEGPTAGGHNAPPRGELKLDDSGQPIYGERDVVDLAKMAELGLPFWVAGGMGTPDGLRAAQAAGARGIQVGTLFAFSQESGLAPTVKQEVLDGVRSGAAYVYTDPRASPTGYPFKVVHIEPRTGTTPGAVAEAVAGSASGEETRQRICDLGYLRIAVRGEGERIIYRCPSEPVGTFVKKGGALEDTVGRRCLCNGLMADIGYPQEQEWATEPPLVTSGDDLASVRRFATESGYPAADVIAWLTGAG